MSKKFSFSNKSITKTSGFKKALIALVLLLVFTFLNLSADERVAVVVGPRVGATYVIVDQPTFNSGVQAVFPDTGRQYFPVLSQFGVNIEQRIRLGGTQSHFVFQEVVLLGGLDQNIYMPSASVLIGFRSRAGLEFGLGPNFSLTTNDGSVGLGITVVYAVGWTFSFQEVYVPVNFAIAPTPKDGRIRLTLLTGFNFNYE